MGGPVRMVVAASAGDSEDSEGAWAGDSEGAVQAEDGERKLRTHKENL
jgi:hypothetical protein